MRRMLLVLRSVKDSSNHLPLFKKIILSIGNCLTKYLIVRHCDRSEIANTSIFFVSVKNEAKYVNIKRWQTKRCKWMENYCKIVLHSPQWLVPQHLEYAHQDIFFVFSQTRYILMSYDMACFLTLAHHTQ